MRSVLEGDVLPGYEGIKDVSRARTPWDQDDAASFLKYGLSQIELDRREAIAARYDQASEIKKDSLPDVWKPLREMAENLLPHLTFERIDTRNKDAIQCHWRVSGRAALVDIDDLSSGEKSIIHIFYPLIEHRIRRVLGTLRGETDVLDTEPVCVLIDEPELHLHPNVQSKVLDYLRALAVREHTQFVIATHSPTIVENSNSDELYLLAPEDKIVSGQNQLLKVATDEEKLHLLREVFGSTSNLTAMRPIVVVEGKREDHKSKRAADARIYTLLSAEFARVTMLPAGGKTECRALAASLNGILQSYSTDLAAYALLDRDLEDDEPTEDNVHLLPVSMIENLLVDPQVIWEATQLVHHKMTLRNEQEVAQVIAEILDEITEDEIARRVKAEVGTKVFRLKDPVGTAAEQAQQFTERLRAELALETMEKLTSTCTSRVDAIRQKNRRREFFQGKRILDEFYAEHLHATGMSKEIFIYECARCAGGRVSVREFVASLMGAFGLVAATPGP